MKAEGATIATIADKVLAIPPQEETLLYI
jgi:hypothetical protein